MLEERRIPILLLGYGQPHWQTAFGLGAGIYIRRHREFYISGNGNLPLISNIYISLQLACIGMLLLLSCSDGTLFVHLRFWLPTPIFQFPFCFTC